MEAVGRRDGSGGRGVAVGRRAVVGWSVGGGGRTRGRRRGREEEVEWVEEEEVEEEERDEEGHEEGDGTRRSAWKSCVVVACVYKRGVCAVLAYCCTGANSKGRWDPRCFQGETGTRSNLQGECNCERIPDIYLTSEVICRPAAGGS